eukprot:1032945-Pleurochrysis_carterae.AAC.2
MKEGSHSVGMNNKVSSNSRVQGNGHGMRVMSAKDGVQETYKRRLRSGRVKSKVSLSCEGQLVHEVPRVSSKAAKNLHD